MPPMTMVFTAHDKKLLEGLKEGDKVRFTADKQNGLYVVTAIEAAR
jgi:Cu(I)/Ag(I) efflux system periplasmic protein CusF